MVLFSKYFFFFHDDTRRTDVHKCTHKTSNFRITSTPKAKLMLAGFLYASHTQIFH
uniref:Uncharacterized protein n=1 Tax=Octopus bimaculoides TaxID=37653 RepID=A0A0L8G0T0_OCTBM